MNPCTIFSVVFIGALLVLSYAPIKTHDYNCPKVRVVEWQRASGRNQFNPAYSIVQTVWDEEAGMCTNGSIGGER
jgi:hypothetical protein